MKVPLWTPSNEQEMPPYLQCGLLAREYGRCYIKFNELGRQREKRERPPRASCPILGHQKEAFTLLGKRNGRKMWREKTEGGMKEGANERRQRDGVA